MRTVRLGEVCQQCRESVRPGERGELRYIGLESIESGSAQFVEGALSKTPEAPQANSFRFGPEHILYGKLRPYLNKVALPDFEGKCSTEIIPLLPSPEADRAYLAFFLRSQQVVEQISARTAGARMPRADMDFVLSLPIPLPPLPEQRRIVDLLSRAEGMVRLRREAEKKAAELIPALFLDMFGDPATNPKGWLTSTLGEVAFVQGGLQVTTARSGLPLERPYLRVANVHRSRLELGEIKKIRLTQAELERTRLVVGDLLVVEGHGNPDEIGRVAIWDGSINDCVHQNHLIRVRPNPDTIHPSYACEFLNSHSGRQSLLRSGKTTSGLNTISVSNVKAATILLPAISLQHEFAIRAKSIRSIQSQQSAATTKVQATFDALLAQAFSKQGKQ